MLARAPAAPAPRAVPRHHALPIIDSDLCTGCGRCIAACPPHVLSLHTADIKKHAALDAPHDCTGCALCYTSCPFDAIQMIKKARAT